MASCLELRCVSNCRCKKQDSNNISFYYFLTFVVDLPTHGSPPCLFYSSQICMAPMALILVSTPRVLLMCSEQLVECQLIQSNANNTNMTLIGAPLLPSATTSIIILYKINLK
jgi:hypothetical protein